jgi:hypothetical protein
MAIDVSEPIIIHGKADGITITHGSSVTTITPDKGKLPFRRVLVRNEAGDKNSSPKELTETWFITIE